MKWYKVLAPGWTWGGRRYPWSLPRGGKPGRWSRRIADPQLCCRGYHLSTDPIQWLGPGCKVYEAEGRYAGGAAPDKCVFGQVRLLRQAPEMIPDWWGPVEAFVAELPTVNWLGRRGPVGAPDPSWQVFGHREAAWEAVRIARRKVQARAASRTRARPAVLGRWWEGQGQAKEPPLAWWEAMDAAWCAARKAGRREAQETALGVAGVSARKAVEHAVGRTAPRAALMAAAGDALRDAALWASILTCAGLPLHQRHVAVGRSRMEIWRRGYGSPSMCGLVDVAHSHVYRQP